MRLVAIVLGIFFSFGSIHYGYGQDSLAIGEVEYVLETKLDESPRKLDGLSTLYFNRSVSLFVHNEVPAEKQFEEVGFEIKVTYGDPDGFPLYIDNQDNSFLQKEHGGVVLQDSLEQTKWTIVRDTSRVIGGQSCLLARGISYGRMYDAWFCPRIPFKAGPYKLRGTPGLILEAASHDGKVKFYFKSMKLNVEADRLIVPPTGKTTYRGIEDYWKGIRKKAERYRKYVNSKNDGSTVTVTKPARRPDITIEKW